MSKCQTRQNYEWITGGCKNILESPNLNKFYYNNIGVKFNRSTVELSVIEKHERIMKDNKIYTPHFSCGSAYIQNLGIGIYNILIRLPVGKHLIPEIRLVNMFGENNNVIQLLKGFTHNREKYSSLFKKQCSVFSYIKNNKKMSEIYLHKKKDWINGVNGGTAKLTLIVTGEYIILKMNNKVILSSLRIYNQDLFKDLDNIASLAIVFALNIDEEYKDGDLKSNFKIVSFDFMPMHLIDDNINK